MIPKDDNSNQNITTESYTHIKKEEIDRRIQSTLNSPNMNDKQKNAINKFYMDLQSKNLSSQSTRTYLVHLKLLLQYFNTHDIRTLKKEDIQKYLLWLSNNFKPKSKTERIKFLLLYFEYIYQKKKEELPIIKDIVIARDKNHKVLEEILTLEEIQKMVKIADNFRDKALIMLLYETGARRGEFLQLKIKHVQFQEVNGKKFAYITLPQGKTTSRKIPVIYSLPHLIAWLNTHPLRDNPDAPLFITQGSYLGRALGDDGLKMRLKKLAKRAGIKKNVFAHLFRHARLTELAKELTEQELKKFAGWVNDSGMASIYVHLSGQDISNKLLANAGIVTQKSISKTEIFKTIECPRCHNLNASDIKICSCGTILDIKEATSTIENYKGMEERFQEMEKRLFDLSSALLNTTKQQSEVKLDKETVSSIVKALRAQKKS